MRTQFYWTTPVAEHGIDYTDAVEQVEKTLGESVAMHMVSDVPVGMMLSGGVDSNTLCDFVHRETNRPFVARCGGGDEPAEAQDDFRFARECAGLHDLDFDEVRVDSQHYLRDWGHLIKAYETPVSTPSDVIIFNVASALKRHVGVALGGEGADEACCGYEVPHWSGADFDLLASLDRLEPQNAEVALASLTAQYGDREIRSPSDLYLACNSLIPASAQRALFHEPMWKLTEEEHAVESWYQDLFAQYVHVPAAEQTAHVLLRTNLESLLARLDSATMLASLEARVPYADHLFVEQLFRLPHAHRIDVSPSEPSPWRSSLELSRRGSLRPKRLIYSIAQRRMPPQLADRRKCSFSTPVPKWLQSDWSEWLSKRVYNSPFAAEIFRPAALKQMEQLPAGLSMWHWGLANVILWGESCF